MIFLKYLAYIHHIFCNIKKNWLNTETQEILCLPSLNKQHEGGGYSHTLPIRVCAAQRGRDFEAPDLERGIHFRADYEEAFI